jgi:hypothetical protein
MPAYPVTIYKPETCHNGYTLFAHTYEDASTGRGGVAHIYLIDMEGRPVHEWTASTAVQLTELLPDGTLAVSTRDRSDLNTAGVYYLAPDSSVTWSYHCRFDHDFHIMDNDHLMIHCLIDRITPPLGKELRRNPYIIEIDRATKDLIWEWHGEEHLEDLAAFFDLSMLLDPERRARQVLKEQLAWDSAVRESSEEAREARVVQQARHFAFDWAHNNTCEVMAENAAAAQDARFRPGNILLSYRSLDAIGVIDRETGAIVWAWGPGTLDGQHQPTMLANGHILVYDNGTRRGYSRVLELDPLTGQIVWHYTADPKPSFFSPFISGAERMPNGNTVICEGSATGDSRRPRLFEVTPAKEIVWEYLSPYADPGTHGIYRAQRYSAAYVEPLLG